MKILKNIVDYNIDICGHYVEDDDWLLKRKILDNSKINFTEVSFYGLLRILHDEFKRHVKFLKRGFENHIVGYDFRVLIDF